MIKAIATAAGSGGVVTATVNGIPTTIRIAKGLTVTANDVLLVDQVGSEWWVSALAYDVAPTPPADSTPGAPAPVPPASGTSTFTAVETRSYRNGAWRTDNDSVYQGQYGGNGLHTGCVFYGRGPRSLAGATVTSASIQVRRLTGGTYAPQTTTLWLITQSTRPAGAPTRTSSTGGPSLAVGATGTHGLLTAWGQALVDGTAGGLAIYTASGSPYVRLAGRGDWSPAFTLTLKWRR